MSICILPAASFAGLQGNEGNFPQIILNKSVLEQGHYKLIFFLFVILHNL